MKKLFLILLLLLCGACASTQRADQTYSRAESRYTDAMNDLAIYAMSLADTPYRMGGATPETGFDCSGFVRHVFQKSLNRQLPRTSIEMSRVGETLSENQLRPGDLVFFNTLQQAFSHVGIYVGENRFVHAPKRGKAITLVNMREDYWRRHYNGARRISPEETRISGR